MRIILAALITVLAMSLTISEVVVAQEENASDRGAHREGDRAMRGDRQRNRAPDSENMINGITRRLDLNDLQSQQVRNIVDAAKPEFEAMREKGRQNHLARRELDVSDADYATRSDALANTRQEIAASSTALRERMRNEINAILTPEQQAKFAEVRENPRRGRHRGRQEHRKPAEIG